MQGPGPIQPTQSIRIRLSISLPEWSRKCWYEVDPTDPSVDTIQKLIECMKGRFGFTCPIDLELDGFALLPTSSTQGVVRDGDLILVKEMDPSNSLFFNAMSQHKDEKSKPLKEDRSSDSSTAAESESDNSSSESGSEDSSSDSETDEEDEKDTEKIPSQEKILDMQDIQFEKPHPIKKNANAGKTPSKETALETPKPPFSLGRHKMKLVKKMQNMQPQHFRFPGQDEESSSTDVTLPQAQAETPESSRKQHASSPAKAAPAASTEPRAIHTSVYIYDGFQRSGPPNKKQKQTNSKANNANGSVHENRSAQDGKSSSSTHINKQITNQKSMQNENYDALPHIIGDPIVGDRVAFKMIEMSEQYTPALSSFKTGVVMAFDTKSTIMLVQLDAKYIRKSKSNPAETSETSRSESRRKFDLIDMDEFTTESPEQNGIISMELANFLELKRLT